MEARLFVEKQLDLKLKIAVIGLGYVGLPLSINLAKYFPVVGFDTNLDRVKELRQGFDRTREIIPVDLQSTSMTFSIAEEEIKSSDVFIITVPTPVDQDNKPDLTAVLDASSLVGKVIQKGAIVVFESTVYPGVTEKIAGPALEASSGLICGEDFFLGYAPERINPGDQLHTVDKITKVVAGQNERVSKILAEIFEKITTGGVFVAKDIRTAEAAKVIENAQRDINIAFINEVTKIFQKMDLSIYDVLDAATTKWNFLEFSPGLVGGHCIGVDPFYLAHSSIVNGHHPEIILAGRKINDGMGVYLGECIASKLIKKNGNCKGRVLVLGVTFKENVPDLRNSRVIDLICTLETKGFLVEVHDALADSEETKQALGVSLVPSLDNIGLFDCIIGAVSHSAYTEFTPETFSSLLVDDGLIADVKGIWRHLDLPKTYARWVL